MTTTETQKGFSHESALIPPSPRLFTINGESKTSTEWAKDYKLSVATVNRKIRKGVDIIDALDLVLYISPLTTLLKEKDSNK